MSWTTEEDERIRRYLLGAVAEAERRQVEEQLLRGAVDELGQEYADRVRLVEEELIDDYARGALTDAERELFERNFMLSPKRREKLWQARALADYASVDVATTAQPDKQHHAVQERENQPPQQAEQSRVREWWLGLFEPWWKVAAYAVLLLVSGLFIWRTWLVPTENREVLAALAQAYEAERPLEARIAGFNYAPFRFSVQKGELQGEGKIDRASLDRAKYLLFGRSATGKGAAELHDLGVFYLAQRDFAEAIKQLKLALESAPRKARWHSDLGAALLGKIENERRTAAGRQNEDVEACLFHLNQALELEPGLLEARFNRALLRQRESLWREARADWEQYLNQDASSLWAQEAQVNLQIIKENLRKTAQREQQLYQDFRAAAQSGDGDKALAAFSLSYSFNGNYIVNKLVAGLLAARFNSRLPEANEQLRVLTQLGKWSEERTSDRFTADLAHYYQQATTEQLTLSQQARRLSEQAYGHYQKSENSRAAELYEQAKETFTLAGNTCEALFAETWVGQCRHQLAETEANLKVFTRLVPLLAQKNYVWLESHASCGLANGHNSTGRFSQAIADSRQCEQLATKVGDQTGVLRSLYMQGYFHYELGRHAENLRLARKGLSLAEQTHAEIRYAITFYNLTAWSLSALGRHEAAAAFQQEAVRMAEESASPRLLARSQIYLGLVYGKAKKYPEAIVSVQNGIRIGRNLAQDKTGQEILHTGLLQLGHLYRTDGRYDEALAAFDEVLKFFADSTGHQFIYAATKGRLLALLARGDEAGAQAELERVLALYDRYRKNIEEESNRNSFFDQEEDVYDLATEFAYFKQHDARLAFAYAERGRASGLAEASFKQAEPLLARNSTAATETSFEQDFQPQQIQANLPDGVQLLSYAVLKNKVLAWVVARQQFKSEILPVSASELTVLINNYLALISQPPDKLDQRWREGARELHRRLLQPLAKLLDQRQQLCIIPDKALAQVAFGALVSIESGRLVAEDYTLSYAASVSQFLALTEQAREKANIAREHLLAVGVARFNQRLYPRLEPLPEAAAEAAQCAAYYQSPKLLVNEQARKSIVLAELAQADVVHLTSHYLPDHYAPLSSQILLAGEGVTAEEGALRLADLYELTQSTLLRPRLVVLSACQTGQEEFQGGDGALGVSRVFTAAGTPLVIASHWRVDAAATKNLMSAFHRVRKRTSLPTAQALRAAQLELLSQPGSYQHPYYWAAFTVCGGYSKY